MPDVHGPKEGPFTNWTETRGQIEVSLPLFNGVSRYDLVVLISATSLSIRHRHIGLMLEATPLAHPVVVEDSSWYLDGLMLVIVLVKQGGVGLPVEHSWGSSLTAPGGILECHLSPRDVTAFMQRRERELEREAAEKRAAREREAEIERIRRERETQAAALRAEDAASEAAEPPSWILDHLHLIVAAIAVIVGAVRMYLLTMQYMHFQREMVDGMGEGEEDHIATAGWHENSVVG